MIKPTYGEIKDFKDWLIASGYETDRDQRRFTKTEYGVSLEFTISKCNDDSFKHLNATISLKFVEPWGKYEAIFRNGDFMSCRALSHEYVSMCEYQAHAMAQEVESFFFKMHNLIAIKNQEIKEINRAAMAKGKDEQRH